jgi:hypothetical protein
MHGLKVTYACVPTKTTLSLCSYGIIAFTRRNRTVLYVVTKFHLLSEYKRYYNCHKTNNKLLPEFCSRIVAGSLAFLCACKKYSNEQSLGARYGSTTDNLLEHMTFVIKSWRFTGGFVLTDWQLSLAKTRLFAAGMFSGSCNTAYSLQNG